MTFSLPEVCYVRPPVMALEREFARFGPPGDARRRPCTRGSHIDYWNGVRYTNSAAGEGGADRNLRLFRRADRVYFCPL